MSTRFQAPRRVSELTPEELAELREAVQNARGLSIAEPYPAYIAAGMKHYETRSRRSGYTGYVVICAGKKVWSTPDALKAYDLPINPGKAVAIARLVKCREIMPEMLSNLDPVELAAGFYSEGRYAWELADIVLLDEPVPVRGFQCLWRFDASILNL